MKIIIAVVLVISIPTNFFAQSTKEKSILSVKKFNHYVLDNQVNNGLNLFIFYSTTCPICKNYTKTVNELSEKFGNKISIYLIFSGGHHSKREIHNYFKKYCLTVQAVLDKKYQLSDEFGAKVTPEAIVYSNGNILYKGAIDDWVIRLGLTKDKVTYHYLQDAIEAVFKGEESFVPTHEAIGCFIR